MSTTLAQDIWLTKYVMLLNINVFGWVKDGYQNKEYNKRRHNQEGEKSKADGIGRYGSIKCERSMKKRCKTSIYLCLSPEIPWFLCSLSPGDLPCLHAKCWNGKLWSLARQPCLELWWNFLKSHHSPAGWILILCLILIFVIEDP